MTLRDLFDWFVSIFSRIINGRILDLTIGEAFTVLVLLLIVLVTLKILLNIFSHSMDVYENDRNQKIDNENN